MPCIIGLNEMAPCVTMDELEGLFGWCPLIRCPLNTPDINEGSLESHAFGFQERGCNPRRLSESEGKRGSEDLSQTKY